jgi:hypothetical protein
MKKKMGKKAFKAGGKMKTDPAVDSKKGSKPKQSNKVKFEKMRKKVFGMK